MLIAVVDAVVLILLLKAISEEETDFMTAFGISLGAAVVTSLLAYFLTVALGLFGLILAALISCGLLGAVVSALFGTEIKRAFLIAGIFVVVHVAIQIGLSLMLGA